MRYDLAPPIPGTTEEAGTVDGVNNGTQLIKIAAAWLMIFMLGIAAAIVTITVINNEKFGPQGTVSSYLKALKDGDGAKALGLLHADVPGANAAALDGKALAESQKKIANIALAEPVDAPNGQKLVTVSYTIAGAAMKTEFRLTQGPKQWLFFNSWDLVPVKLPTISASVVNANQASINGVTANMPDGKNSFAVFYPGSYEMEYRSSLFAAPPVTRNVSGPGVSVPAVALATGPTSNLLSQVDKTIHKYLDSCTKQAVLMPAGCPMSAATDNRVVSEVKWSVVDYPTITITPFAGQWILSPLSVKAQVAYDSQDLFTGLVDGVKDVEEFGFTAKLAISGTSVSVTPVVSY